MRWSPGSVGRELTMRNPKSAWGPCQTKKGDPPMFLSLRAAFAATTLLWFRSSRRIVASMRSGERLDPAESGANIAAAGIHLALQEDLCVLGWLFWHDLVTKRRKSDV